MRHTVISWDCCYRNFFHTAIAMAEQHYDRDAFEVIYVEQRTRASSDRVNHEAGLPSLGDVTRNLEDRLSIKAIYLGDDDDEPFHWGRAVNRGIVEARGRIVSVMDGDVLVDRDFLSKLEDAHAQSENMVLNLHRRMVPEPVGVTRKRWIEQRVDFDSCLEACPDRHEPLPAVANNYGPMISARRDHWDAIEGYDEHPIWSTGLSRVGEDTTKRLETAVGGTSRLLPDTVCVHPWHPVGFRRDTFAARRILALQGRLIGWAKEHGEPSWKDRLPLTSVLYEENRVFVDRMLRSDVAFPSALRSRPSRVAAWVSGVGARVRNREFRELRGQLGTAVRGIRRSRS